MFYRYSYLVLSLLALLLSAQSHANVLITDVRIISKDGEISSPSSVYIQDGKISKIAKKITPRTKDQIVKGLGRFLIPGLIDSHVHLHGVPGESEALPEAIRSQAIQQIPRSYLYFGFTTVLDLNNSSDFITQWNKQELAPRAYHCTGVPIPGGYPLAWLPKNKQLSSPMATFYLYDPRQKELMESTKGSEHHKVKPLVKAIAGTQARCIKTFYEKGFGPFKNLPVPSKKMIVDLVTEAHKYDLPVFVHGNSTEAHKFAIDVGAQLLVHGVWHNVKNSTSLTVKQVAALSKTKGVAVQPTIQVLYGEAEIFNHKFFDNDAVKKAIPQNLIDWYQSKPGQWFAERIAINFGHVDKDQRAQAVKKQYNWAVGTSKTHTRALVAEKAKLRFGSDTPSGPLYTQFPGFNGREEMDRWTEAGVPLLTLFKALTYDNAKLLKLENKIGSIEVGKQADLLLLKQNPLKDIKAYDSIERLILNGKVIEREQLAAN